VAGAGASGEGAVTESPAPWHRVATLAGLPAGTMRAVAVDGVAVLLLNLGGDVFAYDDHCPHAANPLSLGRLEGEILVCAAHEWAFDSRLGEGVNPASVCLRRYQVRVDDGVILVRVDAGGPIT